MKDRSMYYKETNQACLARTSNLNEELGQIEVRGWCGVVDARRLPPTLPTTSSNP